MDSRRDIKNKIWLSRWYRLRKLGLVRYSLQYGFLYFGLTLAAGVLMLSSFTGEQLQGIILFRNIFANVLMAVGAGVVLSVVIWVFNELRFRRLGARYPSALQYF